MTIEIHPALPSDAAQILTFITELAEYEKPPRSDRQRGGYGAQPVKRKVPPPMA